MHPLSRLCLAGETTSVSPDAIESPLIDSNCWRISDSVSPKTCFQSRMLLQVEPLGLFGPRAGAVSLEHGVLRSKQLTERFLFWRLQLAKEPTNSIGFHWIIRRYGDSFDVIAFGAVEPLEFKSCRPRRGARKLHARAAFWAAELLNCEHWDCGWVICHCIPPCFRRVRNTLSHPLEGEYGRCWTTYCSATPGR